VKQFTEQERKKTVKEKSDMNTCCRQIQQIINGVTFDLL